MSKSVNSLTALTGCLLLGAAVLTPGFSAHALTNPGIVSQSSTGEWQGVHAPRGDWLWPALNSIEETGQAWLNAELDKRRMGDSTDNFIIHRKGRDLGGRQHLVLDQIYHGFPLLGQSLNLHFSAEDALLSANGNFRHPDSKLNLTAKVDLNEALAAAYQVEPGWEPELLGSRLVIHSPQWLGEATGSQRLVWELELADLVLGKERVVLIDALSAEAIATWSSRPTFRDRRIYDGQGSSSLPGVLQRAEGDVASGDADLDAAYDYYGDTYDYFARAFNRDSIDDAGLPMVATAHSTAPNCPNAFWSNVLQQMVFCNGTVTDDVVGHELTHGITSTTARLIYENQSGQLNESFSDVFGELIDLYNGDASVAGSPGGTAWPTHATGPGGDTPNNLRSSCSVAHSDGVRWLIAEDAAAFGGGIRDMWDPTCRNHPDTANSPLQTCPSSDSGGVHSGSGVPNHAFAMLVDGKIFNGHTIQSIGPIKAGAIWYQCLNWFLTPSSDFEDAALAFDLAAQSLLGITLQDPRTGLASVESITTSDRNQVVEAMLAVEMNTEGACGSNDQILSPRIPLSCETGTLLFLEDFESGAAGWTTSHTAMPTPYDWTLAQSLPLNHSGTSAFCEDRSVGDCFGQDESGQHVFISPWIHLNPADPSLLLEFDHYFSTEAGWDGCVLQIEDPLGTLQTPGTENWLFNPPTAPLNPGTPLSSLPGFTASVSNWGRSQLDLTTTAEGLDSLRLHFVLAKDGCTGLEGWYVDNVRLRSCIDCDQDGFDDRSQFATALSSPDLPVPDSNVTQHWYTAPLVPAETDVELILSARGDFSGELEYIDVLLNDTLLGRILESDGSDCSNSPHVKSLILDPAFFNAAINQNTGNHFEFVGGPEISIGLCPLSEYLHANLYYTHNISSDQNANGVPDDCETPPDLTLDYSGSQLLLQWSAISWADHYNVYLNTSGTLTLITSTTDLQLDISSRLGTGSPTRLEMFVVRAGN